jgi:hypothetical protein
MAAMLALGWIFLDDLVLSASAASAGGHRSLRLFPGAVLRGLFASHLYDEPNIDTYRLFHSGELRFGDACRSPPMVSRPCRCRSPSTTRRQTSIGIRKRDG